MPLSANTVDKSKFNHRLSLPFELRLMDFDSAMQDVYDFFYDVNSHLVGKGLERLDDMLRPAILSGVLSDMVTASLARHSRAYREPLLQRAPRPCGEGILRQQLGEGG